MIVIPGAFGSRLLDTHTGKEIWPRSSTKLLLSSFKGLEVEFDEDTLDPSVSGIQPYRIFRQGLGRDFYGQILETLQGAGGYTRRRPNEPVEPGQRNFYVYLYDWRLDNISALQGLHRLIWQIRADYGKPDLRVDILAHSNGGLLARYYARYGPVDHLEHGSAPPTYAGATAIRRLLMVGTPNLGSMQPVLSHVRGEEMGLRKIPAEVVATISGAPQLMPHPALPWLLDTRGNLIAKDVFDMDTWRELRWSIFDPDVRSRTIARKGGGRVGRRYLDRLEAYLEKHMARGRNFLQLIAAETDSRDVRPFVFGGDCDATVARLIVEQVRGKLLARENPVKLVRPERDLNYHDLIHDPGDSVVTRNSLLGSAPQALMSGFDPPAPPALSHAVFLCEQHQFLTGNAVFQNNLLHTLFGLQDA